MEFYEQGKLLFRQGQTFKASISGVRLDMYIAAAEAFTSAHLALYNSNPLVSDQAALMAYHLYRYCLSNSEVDSAIYNESLTQLKTFVF